MRTREPASFWRENEAAVVTLLRVLTSGRSGRRSCGNNVKRFLILQTGEGLASFNKDTGLYGWKKYNKAFRGLHFWEYTKKTLKRNLVLVVVLVLQSTGLCCFSVVTMLLQVSHQSEMRYYTPLLNDPPINNTNKEVYTTFLRYCQCTGPKFSKLSWNISLSITGLKSPFHS